MDLAGIWLWKLPESLRDGANDVKLLLVSEKLCIELVGTPDICGEKPGVTGESECLPQSVCGGGSPGEEYPADIGPFSGNGEPHEVLCCCGNSKARICSGTKNDYQYSLSRYVNRNMVGDSPLVNGETSPALIAADDEGYSGVDKGNEEEYELKGSTWVNMWPP